jgi:AbrB family looped-hinge helix DNA binding protein
MVYETMASAALTRITSNFQITMPKAARDALRLKRGDLLEATVERGAVVLRPKVLRDREEIVKQLKKDIEAGVRDVRAGRVLGPFDNADDAQRGFEVFKRKRRPHARRRQPTRR